MIRIFVFALIAAGLLVAVRLAIYRRRRRGAIGLEILFAAGVLSFLSFGAVVVKYLVESFGDLVRLEAPAHSQNTLLSVAGFAALAAAGFYLARFALRKLRESA
jgi:hypothetical protein